MRTSFLRWVATLVVAMCVLSGQAQAQPSADFRARALAIAQTIEREELFARKSDWDALRARAENAPAETRMNSYFLIASYHLTQGDNTAADQTADQLIAQAKRVGSKRFDDIGQILKYAAAETVEMAEPVKAIGAKSDDPVVIAVSHAFVGEIYREAGRTVEAVGLLVQALRLAEGEGVVLQALRRDVLGYLALSRDELGDTEGALREYGRLLDYARADPRQFDGVTFLFNLALMASQLEMHDLAREIAVIEHSVAVKNGSPIEVFYAFALCANLARERNDWPEARQCASSALSQEAQDRIYAAHMRWTRALGAAQMNDLAAAKADRDAIAHEAYYRDSADGRLHWLRLEAEILRAQGNTEASFNKMREHARMIERLANQRFKDGAFQLRAQMEADIEEQRGRAEAASLLAARQGWIVALSVVIVLVAGLALFWRMRAERAARRMLAQARASLAGRAELLQAAMIETGADPAPPRPEPCARGATLKQLDWLFSEIDRRDETLKEAITALAAARTAAEGASVAKSEFLAVVSHELRTPMNAIIGYSEILREDLAAGEAANAADVERISAAAGRLLTLINQILRFEKLQQAPEAIALAPVGLQDAFDEVAAIVRPMTNRATVQLSTTVAADAALALADREKLIQALINLAGNAAKFTSAGKIDLWARREDEVIVIEVRDTGVGIPADKLTSVFEAFTQVDSSLSRRYEGTGLGLAISKGLVERMGGALSVDSQVGRGSCFTIRLQAAEAMAVAA
jgi:signal transduction histidine kinase